MPEYTVWFTQTASTRAVVEAEDYEEAIELAWDQLPGSLCHQCAGEYEMAGDWEPDVVTDSEGETVWEERRR